MYSNVDVFVFACGYICRCIRPVTGMYYYTYVFVHNLYLHVDVQGASKKPSFCESWSWQILLLTVKNPYIEYIELLQL